MSHQDHIRWTLRWLIAQGQLSLKEARALSRRWQIKPDELLASQTGKADDAELALQCALDEECTTALEAEIERSGAFERSRQIALTRRLQHERERAQAPQLYAQILALMEESRSQRLEQQPQFHTRALVDLLLEESKQAWFQDLSRAERINRLGLDLLECLDQEVYGQDVLEDLKAKAWSYLGSVHRKKNRWAQAEDAFRRADASAGKGTGDPLVQANLLHLKATLLYDQRYLTEASDLMDEAIRIYQELGEHHLVGRTMISRANVLKEQSNLDQAIVLLRQALQRIDPQQEPRLQLFAGHNLMFFLCEMDRADEAAALLEGFRSQYLQYPVPTAQLRLRWLEGKIALGTGNLAEAEIALKATQQGFEEQEASYEAALAALDLAAVYALERRTVALKRLASELFAAFEAHDIHREATAALILFRQAADLEQVTLEVVKRVSTQIERSQYLPPDNPS